MRLLPNDREEGWTPYAWLVYLVLFVCWPAMKRGTTPLEWALTAVGLVAFLALYFRGFWERGARLMVIIAAICVLAVLYWPSNPGAGSFFIYAAAFAGDLQPPRRAVQLIVAVEAIVLLQSIALRSPWYDFIWPLVFSPLIGAINMHQRQRKIAHARLQLAHDEIERLAKTAERERIARDLHDLLGHTLTVIIVKSEL